MITPIHPIHDNGAMTSTPHRRFRRKLSLALAVLPALSPLPVRAQPYPSRQITLVVAFGTGGVTDTLTRMIARHLSERLRVPVIVENRPGASQINGIQYVKTRPADGYTLLVGTGSSLVQNPGVRKDLPYDPERDFAPVAMIGMQPGVISVAPAMPARTLQELIDHAKRNPGKLNFGSQGVGSAGHLAAEIFMARTGISMVHIPLKSDNDIVIELSENRIDVAFITPQFAVPFAKEGKQRILAVTSVDRLPFLPDLPSLKEAGIAALRDLDPFTFYGLVALAATPPEVVRTVNEQVNEILQTPQVAEQMRTTFRVEPRPQSPQAYREFLRAELDKWRETGARLNLDTK